MAIVSGRTCDVRNFPDEQVGAVLGANGRAEAVTAGALRSGLHSMLSYSTGEIGRLGEVLRWPTAAQGHDRHIELCPRQVRSTAYSGRKRGRTSALSRIPVVLGTGSEE